MILQNVGSIIELLKVVHILDIINILYIYIMENGALV